MDKILNYINDSLNEPVNGKYLDNINPATGEVYSLIPDSSENDVELAVDAAKKAFHHWSSLPAAKRADYLLNIADKITEKIDELALAETTDNGKPLWLSRAMDIPRASQNFSFYATGILHEFNEVHSTTHALNYTYRSPVGLAGCISPWNLPLYLFSWKIAPALAAGCCVVAKPSELTPMTAYLLSKICLEVNLPAGVLNIVHGTGPNAGMPIVAHKDVRAISFTGGTKTGAEISRVAGPIFKKLSLELGGKNPNIIFADCDFEAMMAVTMQSSFTNQGQICLCGSRIFIEKPLYEKFKNEFVVRTKALKISDPLDETVKVGAVVSKAHKEKILGYLKLAEDEGGRILTGGNEFFPEGRCKNGYFIEPTIIEGLSQDCRTNQEEIFGPVVTIQPFEKEEEAIQYANATPYGLSATIWTQNLTRAHKLAQNIQSGIIWINCWLVRDLRTPFGGMKQSGIGREGGFEALKFFTDTKNICVKL